VRRKNYHPEALVDPYCCCDTFIYAVAIRSGST
jgi:hypothetical protein